MSALWDFFVWGWTIIGVFFTTLFVFMFLAGLVGAVVDWWRDKQNKG